jgi:glycosyltransferase involved in cell wall biosynthesis
MKPLVSILIPAHNAEPWVGDTIQSALTQGWSRKEIIVVDDGSRDGTAAVAQRFASKDVAVVSQENQGAAAARNHALRLSQGDYIQWLDADDLLAPDKIERQLEVLREVDSNRILLSSAWAHFYHRPHRARFCPSPLWRDLSPVDWLLTKLGENVYMQTATWLTSRELTKSAGSWDTRLLSDDDGEYFCRVLLASEGTRFVRTAKVFYRDSSSSRLSHIRESQKKKAAMLLSLRLHIRYLCSLEESERVRKVCLRYLQCWYHHFYPEVPDMAADMRNLAGQLGGSLEAPCLRWKYAWIEPIFGWPAAKRAEVVGQELKQSIIRKWDKAMSRLESRNGAASSF